MRAELASGVMVLGPAAEGMALRLAARIDAPEGETAASLTALVEAFQQDVAGGEPGGGAGGPVDELERLRRRRGRKQLL